jgi:hypothetical protein
VPKIAESTERAGDNLLDPSLAPASGMATQAVEQATAMVRSVSDQASAATGALYRQSARPGEYLTRNVNRVAITGQKDRARHR